MIKSKELFPNPSITQQEVDNIVRSELHDLSQFEIGQFLFLSGKFSKKKYRKNKINLVQRHLGVIESSLRRFPNSSWPGIAVSFMINSLQVVQSSDQRVKEFLTFLTSVVRESLNDSNILNQQNVAMIMYGLRRMCSSCLEVCALLKSLIVNVDKCTETFDAQAVGTSLYGMQKMSSDSGEVRAMLSALVPKVESCREALDAQAVGNSLYGMQGMSSDSGEVRAMLSALVPKVESCREALNAQHVGNALYGMRKVSSDSVEVRAMLSALVPKVDSCRAVLNAQEVGNSLYGLQGMSSDSTEVRAMLSALVPKESC
jgi:conjugal transfer/entry exclusion protein